MCHACLVVKCALGRRCENVAERCDEGLPIAAASGECAVALGGEAVDAGAGPASTVRVALPSGGDLPCFLQPIQGRVERAFLEFEQAAAADFQPAENFQTVCLAAFERGEA